MSVDLLTLKTFIAGFATVFTVASYIPYFRDVFSGATKPHAFSWLIWSLLQAIAFAGQQSEGAGVGAWVNGGTALLCLCVFLCSLKYGEKEIRRFDWICLIFALSAIPVWILTSRALWAIVLVTVIDVVAFLPTVRKSYWKPHQETAISYFFAMIKFILSIAALEHYSFATVLYPGSIVISNGTFLIMIMWRRRVLGERVQRKS